MLAAHREAASFGETPAFAAAGTFHTTAFVSHAALSIGSHVSPYEIVAAVGAGGTGAVYRARDARLHRDVAVRVLLTPDTVLRWYRALVAKKDDGSPERRPGRPRIKADLAALVVRMATENPT